MDNKFWNKTIVLGAAGILSNIIALALLFVPQNGEDRVLNLAWSSPQGIVVIVLIAINVTLFFVGIFMKERNLSFNDKKALVEERQQTLLKLQLSIESRLKAARTLITKAEKLSLMQYWEKYLKHTFPYIFTKRTPKTPLEITNHLVRHRFVWNNLYYRELKENDGNYHQVKDNYEINLSKVDDRAKKLLKPALDWLWIFEQWTNSTQIYASISMKNKKIPNVPLGYRWGLYGKHKSNETLQSCVDRVESKIGSLKRGEDL